MKKFGLLLLVVAVVLCVSTATSQAALVSLFTFDTTSTTTLVNAVLGGGDMTMVGGLGTNAWSRTAWVAGPVGTNALDFISPPSAAPDYGTIVAGQPSPSVINGKTGAVSFWINATTSAIGTILGAKGTNVGGTPATNAAIFDLGMNQGINDAQSTNTIKLQIRTDGDGASSNERTLTAQFAPTTAWRNGSWHQVTLSWETTQGTSGTGSMKLFIDGAAETSITYGSNNISSADVIPAWNHPMYVGTIGRDTPQTGMYLDGALDDLAVWSNEVDQTQAKAIYNLATDTLDYNTANAAALFTLYGQSVGSEAEVGGVTWTKVNSGLSGSEGAVVDLGGGIKGLILGSGGAGVQMVPEPGTLALLGAALMGLLVFAWRKRK